MSRVAPIDFVVTPIDPKREDEKGFVYSSWTRSYQETEENERIPYGAYFPHQRKVIAEIMNRGATCLVARDAESPSLLYGYVVAEVIRDALIVHWINVKSAYRRMGIANALLRALLSQLGQGATKLYFSHFVPRWIAKAESLGMSYLSVDSIKHLLAPPVEKRAPRRGARR